MHHVTIKPNKTTVFVGSNFVKFPPTLAQRWPRR